MRCIDCEKFRFLTDNGKEVYGFCGKKKKKLLPFDLCKQTAKEKEEMRIISFYLEHYKEMDFEQIVKKLNIKGLDVYRLNYLATKHYLPRKLWGE